MILRRVLATKIASGRDASHPGGKAGLWHEILHSEAGQVGHGAAK